MNEIDDNTIDLIITSPPYFNAINYAKQQNDEYYRGNDKITFDGYLQSMKLSFQQCFLKNKNGSFCIINIGDILAKNEIIPLFPHFYFMMKEIGYIFHQNIIWSKVTGGAPRFGVTIQNPYPTYYYPNQMSEEILVFRKGNLVHKKDEASKFSIDEVMKKEIDNNIWHIAPVPPNQYSHPCPFPEDIPYRLIMLYSNVNDIILDPFNGIGTTTKVAKCMNRQFVGYDIVEEYCKIAEQRLEDKLNLRRQMIMKAEFVDEEITNGKNLGDWF